MHEERFSGTPYPLPLRIEFVLEFPTLTKINFLKMRIFLSKWANYLRKFGKNPSFSPNFPMIFVSAVVK